MASAQPCADHANKAKQNKIQSKQNQQKNNLHTTCRQIRKANPEWKKQLAATDYLTNPCNIKKMSSWMLNMQVFAQELHLAGAMSKTTIIYMKKKLS